MKITVKYLDYPNCARESFYISYYWNKLGWGLNFMLKLLLKGSQQCYFWKSWLLDMEQYWIYVCWFICLNLSYEWIQGCLGDSLIWSLVTRVYIYTDEVIFHNHNRTKNFVPEQPETMSLFSSGGFWRIEYKVVTYCKH